MQPIIVSLLIFLSLTLQAQKNIFIQPLGEVSTQVINVIKSSVEQFYGFNCIVKPKVNFTNEILADSRTRYEASRILRKYKSTENLLIITEKDIACEKGSIHEWGIFGLGYRPGVTCVVSTFRLKRNVSKDKFYDRVTKVCLHEIGHNLGVVHCNFDKKCMMNDARGKIKQVDQEKIWFCDNCKKYIGIH